MAAHVSSLDSSVRSGSDSTQKYLEEEFRVIKSKLNALVTASMTKSRNRDELLLRPYSTIEQGSSSPDYSRMDSLELRSIQTQDSRSLVKVFRHSSKIQFKSLRSVLWRWSSYSLPIGILAIEMRQAELKSSNSQRRSTEGKSYTIKFRFAPLLWIMDRIVQVSYTISISDYRLPYWQSEMSDETSLIPRELEESFQDGALIDFLDCMEAMPFASIHNIITMRWRPKPWDPKVRMPSSPFLDCRFYSSFNGFSVGRAVELCLKTRHTDPHRNFQNLKFVGPNPCMQA